MIVTALLLILAFVVSYYAGYIGLSRLFYLLKTESNDIHVSLCQLVGLAFIAFISSLLHLFYPITQSTFFIISFSFISSSFIYPKMFNEASKHLLNSLKKYKYTYTISFIIAVISLSARPGTGDIADYHLQAIKWTEHYKNIFGLSNFNRPLANNNWWFNLQAFFGNANQSMYVLNALLFIIVFCFLLQDEVENKSLHIFKYILAGFVAVSTKTAFVGSVTPDYVITNLIFICSYLYLKYSIKKNTHLLHIIILLALFAITVKLNSILLLGLALLSFIALLKQGEAKKYWLVYGSISLISLSVWLIGNVIISGWLCYPISSIDLFHFDWKMPKEVLEMERFSIKQWGKVPFQDIQITAQMRLSEWLPLWIEKLDVFNKILLTSSIIVFTFFAIMLIVKKEKQKAIFILAALSVVGILFCFSNGPHVRYAYGYIVVLLALGISYLVSSKINLPHKWMLPILVLVSIIGIVPKIIEMKMDGSLLSNIVYPKAYPVYVLDELQTNGNTLFISKQNSTCWATFPCSYYMLNACVLRSNSMEDGFKVIAK